MAADLLKEERKPKNIIVIRIFEKAPHYTIGHVDISLMNIQRSFSFDGVSIYDALNINFKHKQQLNLKSLILISGLFDLKETLATKFPFYKLMYAVFTGDETKNVNAAMCSKERDIYSIYDKMKSSYPKTFIITGSNDPLKACSISLNKVLQAKNIEHEFYYCKSFFSSLHSGGIHVKRGDGKIALEKTLKFIKN